MVSSSPTDEELDSVLLAVERGDRKSAALALAAMATRLAQGKRLTGPTLVALVRGLIATIDSGKAPTFLGAGRRPVGRPKGAATRTDLARVFAQYGAAKGYLPEAQRTIGPRQQQRLRALIRGTPGKPGRPKKSDKK